jgi:hypothetical protein
MSRPSSAEEREKEDYRSRLPDAGLDEEEA